MIETKLDNGVLTAMVDGRIDGTNAKEFQQELEKAIADVDKAVLLDMSGLAYISSAGLRVMLLVAKTLDKQDVKFAVYAMSEQIRDVFLISGFDKIINVYDSREQALTILEG